MNLKRFIRECNEKEVFKKLSIYLVSSWVLIQVTDVLTNPLGLPEKSVTFLIIILLIGFPINGFLVWKLHLAPMEHQKMKLDADGNMVRDRGKMSGFQKNYYVSLAIVSLAALIAVISLVNKRFFMTGGIEPLDVTDKIAVMKFGNNTGDKNFDIVGKMAADWIIHGITENEMGQVISPEIIEDYSEVLKASISPAASLSMVRDYFKPGKIISGNFYLENDKLLFQGSIQDSQKNNKVISFKLVECDSDEPLDCIEKLKQLILGYLITTENSALNLQDDPPKFEAYQYLLDAKENYDNREVYIDLLNKSIAADDNYFEPKVLRVGFYYNPGQYLKADSLLKNIIPDSENKLRQQNLLNLYGALLKGQNDKTYRYMKYEYNMAPFDLFSNSSTMVAALQFVNRPQDIDSIYEEISMNGMDLVKCRNCENRIYIKALAELELGRFEQAIGLLKESLKDLDGVYLKKVLLKAFIRNGNVKEEKDMLLKWEITSSKKEWREACLLAGQEYLLLNNRTQADMYFEEVMNSYDEFELDEVYAKAAYSIGKYKEGEKILERMVLIHPENQELRSRLAVCQVMNGKSREARETIRALQGLKADFQFGKTDYAEAQYHAAVGNKAAAMSSLLKAVAQGYYYLPDTYQNDPHFVSYVNEMEFKNILNYWN